MADYPDEPDYHQASTPGVTRWAPGTEYGSVYWHADVNANTNQEVTYDFPNNGYLYVLDKVFIVSAHVGIVASGFGFCNDVAAPVWILIAATEHETILEYQPFSFVSMALGYPQGLKWWIYNSNNVSRHFDMIATLYRYLSSA